MKKSFLVLLVLSLFIFIANAQEQDYIVHKIKSGESLYALTKKYKVSMDEIKKANPNLGAKIDIGTEVKIPKKGSSASSAKPKNTEPKPKEPVQEEQTETASEGQFIKHKLKAKESFAVLSRKYGVSIAEIKKANPKLGTSVKVGTLINIPQKPTSSTSSETTKEQEPATVTTPEPATEVTTNSNSDEVYIYHKVKSRETLYTLAKKYRKTVAVLKKTNPEIGSGGLKIGQLIKIPTGKKTPKQEPINATQTSSTTVVEDTPSLPNSAGEITHKVKSKQTLFSIAKEYKVSVNDIKKWNGLTGASHLKLGQELIIKTREDIAPVEKKQPKEPKEEITKVEPTIKEKPTKSETVSPKPITGNTEPDEPIKQDITKPAIALKEPEPQPEVDPDKIKVTTSTAVNASGYSKITETGLAELMGETVESTKFLALHKTAPIGTLIQVKNPMTGIAIFVRIIGKLPDNSSNDKIIIKVTKKVRERIGALNNRFPVEISYIP